MERSTHESRKRTPWDGKEMNPTQRFLYDHYSKHYQERHPSLSEAGEAEMVNSYTPKACPFCRSAHFKKDGYDGNGIRRFQCISCGKKFKPTTGTIFDSRRIPVSEWMEYCLNIFRYVSLNADSWNNRNAFTTAKYWLKKLFLTLEHYQDDIMLGGTVWLDETYYSVLMRDREHNADGQLLRGLSRNQICVGVATDKKQVICVVEGYGKPSQKKSLDAFRSHIVPGSTLIHDKESTHRKLIQVLSLNSVEHLSAETKNLPDKSNPLEPVNHIHFLLKRFLNAHSGFNRDELSGYLNLFAYVMNPPEERLEKVEKIVRMGFENPKLLRYREAMGANRDI